MLGFRPLFSILSVFRYYHFINMITIKRKMQMHSKFGSVSQSVSQSKCIEFIKRECKWKKERKSERKLDFFFWAAQTFGNAKSGLYYGFYCSLYFSFSFLLYIYTGDLFVVAAVAAAAAVVPFLSFSFSSAQQQPQTLRERHATLLCDGHKNSNEKKKKKKK